jgi:hypothetical protein
MANILNTGGRGFIGTNLTQDPCSRGHQVWTWDILHGEDPQHLRPDFGVYIWMPAFVNTDLSMSIISQPNMGGGMGRTIITIFGGPTSSATGTYYGCKNNFDSAIERFIVGQHK